MPQFDDPARLSKCRLKSDLVAHNVALPPANSKKEVYVELHLKHIEQQKHAAEFSSDEEDQGVAVSCSSIKIFPLFVNQWGHLSIAAAQCIQSIKNM